MTENSAREQGLASLAALEQFDAMLTEFDRIEDFDASFGVETSSPVEPWEIDEADDRTLKNNSRYSPTPVRTIREAIAASPLGHKDMSFVDFGSGKGRALLVASEFPFSKVIGIEFSRALCDIAQNNIDRYRGARQCGAVEVHCQSAESYSIPDDASFFYFYEPFSATVAQMVLHHIEASLEHCPRPAVVCMVGRSLLPTIDARSHWRQLGETLKSPDDSYFDTRFFTYEVGAAGHSASNSRVPQER
ncbi:class I SAM-dependent methyltransferase [Streptomyces chartreusis]|uniref:class I SAM-dependent methyltransferase n=1 Tax=Streptomyces chartreusis TaxID=1969 RepID=UPI00339E44D4